MYVEGPLKKLFLIWSAGVLCAPWGARLHATEVRGNSCYRPSIGSAVPEPEDLRSRNGVRKVDLTIHNVTEPDGSTRYCYIDGNGNVSPNLRLKPGDLLILRLKNDLSDSDATAAPANHHAYMHAGKSADPCSSGAMTSTSTNLHFHGLTIPPVCHQDDVVKTSVGPQDPPFEYRFHIPSDEPPGLIGIIPTFTGSVKCRSLGGPSGALIVEGIERANKQVAGLAERVLIVRDQD